MDTKSSKCVHLVEGGTNGPQCVHMAPIGKTSLGRVTHARKRQKTSFTNLETHGDRSGYLACDTCSSGVPKGIVPAGIVPIGNIPVRNNLGVQTRTKGIRKWLVLMTPLGEACHVLQRKLGLALEAAGPTHVDYMAAVDRQRGLYSGARQWKELHKCVQKHVQDKRSGLQLIPTSHRIRWSQANARRNTAIFGQCLVGGTTLGFQVAAFYQGGGCVGGLP